VLDEDSLDKFLIIVTDEFVIVNLISLSLFSFEILIRKNY